MKSRTAKKIAKPANGRLPQVKEPNVSNLEVVIREILNNAPDWVLVERIPKDQKEQSSSMYLSLQRRGFKIAVRHDAGEAGAKNTWACWPHPVPEIDLQTFPGDELLAYFGEVPDDADGMGPLDS